MLVTLANVHLLVSRACSEPQSVKQNSMLVTLASVMLAGSVSVLRFEAPLMNRFILVAASKSQPLRSRLRISLF